MRDGIVVADGSPDEVITPTHLESAYGARARIGRNPVTGRPLILSLTSIRGEETAATAPPVHVICGGGSGIHIFHALLRHGYSISTGVLNESDSDCETAVALGIETLLEAPYTAISHEHREELTTLMSRSEAILVADVPFGPGNLANLEATAAASALGKPVALIGAVSAEDRDYTKGVASKLLSELTSSGAKRFDTVEEWIALDTSHRAALVPLLASPSERSGEGSVR